MGRRFGAALLLLGGASDVPQVLAVGAHELPASGNHAGCVQQRELFVARVVESAENDGRLVSVTHRPDGVVVVTYEGYEEFLSCSGETLEIHFSDPAFAAPADRQGERGR